MPNCLSFANSGTAEGMNSTFVIWMLFLEEVGRRSECGEPTSMKRKTHRSWVQRTMTTPPRRVRKAIEVVALACALKVSVQPYHLPFSNETAHRSNFPARSLYVIRFPII